MTTEQLHVCLIVSHMFQLFQWLCIVSSVMQIIELHSAKWSFGENALFLSRRSFGVVCLTLFTFRCGLLCIYAQCKAISSGEKKTLLHLMQITIENNITNILFYPATEIKLYRHQMRNEWAERKLQIFAIQKCSLVYTFLLWKVFLLFFDCGNIKFHCICAMDMDFSGIDSMISLLFF